MNLAQKQFARTFSIAVSSVVVWAIGWEYFPETRVWLTIALVVLNSPGLLRDFRNLRSTDYNYDSNRFTGLSSRKPWVLWVMGLYGIAAAVFFGLAVTGRFHVSDIDLPCLLLMLAPLGIPGTVIYYERLGNASP